MTIYIDADYKCHVSADGTMRAFVVPFFTGKCREFVEGYLYIPPGEKLVQENGVILRGEQRTPWRDYSRLAALQAVYEQGQQSAAPAEDPEKEDLIAAVETLGVTDDE